MLVLPFAYRAIDAGLGAIDIVTLAEAARSLGSSLAAGAAPGHHPEHPRRASCSASVVSVALVLGEFTIASLLNFDTLQVVDQPAGQAQRGRRRSRSRVAALLFAFVLLLVLAYVAPRRPVAAVVEGVPSGACCT